MAVVWFYEEPPFFLRLRPLLYRAFVSRRTPLRTGQRASIPSFLALLFQVVADAGDDLSFAQQQQAFD